MSEAGRQRLPLSIPLDHPSFAGHFPGRPIVPGALLIDLAVHAIETACSRRIASIAQAKFVSPAVPGEVIALDFELSADAVRFDIACVGDNARKLVSGRMSFEKAAA